MIYIAHRGNILGPNPDRENRLDYVLDTLQQGYDVELDVYYYMNVFYFSHDYSIYLIRDNLHTYEKIPNELLEHSNHIWFHCKNVAAANELSKLPELNYFMHDNDPAVLTSKKFLWTFPGNFNLTSNSVVVMPEYSKNSYSISNLDKIKKCYAICTDYPKSLKERMEK